VHVLVLTIEWPYYVRGTNTIITKTTLFYLMVQVYLHYYLPLPSNKNKAVLDKNIHAALISSLNTTGMTNLMTSHIFFLFYHVNIRPEVHVPSLRFSNTVMWRGTMFEWTCGFSSEQKTVRVISNLHESRIHSGL